VNIAIIRLSSLGDIVFSSPVAFWLKTLYPNAKISWYVDFDFKEILEDCPYIDEIVTINLRGAKKSKSIAKIIEEIANLKNSPKYDYIIDLQGLIKSGLIVWLLKGNKIGFDFKSAREGIASFFYHTKIYSNYNLNILTRYEDLIKKSLGNFNIINNSILGAKSENPKIKDAILINIGASKANKRYPFYAEVIKSLDREVFLIWGSNEEFEIAKDIAASTNAFLLPRLNITDIKCAIKSAALVIGGDSGITHLAWGLRVPSITLFGATPYKRNCVQTDINIAISANENIDAKKLDYNDFSIAQIAPQEILIKAKQLLND
jgi:heptosyltransferase-1